MAGELLGLSFVLHALRSLVGLVFVTSSIVGCAGSSPMLTIAPSPGGGSQALTVEQLEGSWRLLSIQLTGRAEQATPDGATYTIDLANGRLSSQVDCNTCSGAFALSGRTFTAGPALACTRAACRTMAFEASYTSLLSGDSAITYSDGAFVLSSPRGVLRFAR